MAGALTECAVGPRAGGRLYAEPASSSTRGQGGIPDGSSFQPFHLASGLEYVASGAYLEQPSFQRYLQQRAERIRSSGGTVELWPDKN